jgi:hypothetical protein
MKRTRTTTAPASPVSPATAVAKRTHPAVAGTMKCQDCLVSVPRDAARPGHRTCSSCAHKSLISDIAARRLLPEKQCIFVDTTGECRVIPLEDLEATLGGRFFTQLPNTVDAASHYDAITPYPVPRKSWGAVPNVLGQHIMCKLECFYVHDDDPICGDICFAGPGRSGLFPSEVTRILAMAEEFASKE